MQKTKKQGIPQQCEARSKTKGKKNYKKNEDDKTQLKNKLTK